MQILFLVSLTAVDLLSCLLILHHYSAHFSLSLIFNLYTYLSVSLLLDDFTLFEDRSDSEDLGQLSNRLI